MKDGTGTGSTNTWNGQSRKSFLRHPFHSLLIYELV